jgi:hypothetical protein
MRKFFWLLLLPMVCHGTTPWNGSESFYLAAVLVRDYYVPLTPENQKDIGYIVNTLGMASLGKIGKAKSSLKKAGDRIDHIHPLRFLMRIFTDEEMKVSIHAMQSRGWVWDEFYGGLKKSLEEESFRGNMRVEMIADFSIQVGLPFDMIYPVTAERHWKQLIDLLVQNIPRSTQKNRYGW